MRRGSHRSPAVADVTAIFARELRLVKRARRIRRRNNRFARAPKETPSAGESVPERGRERERRNAREHARVRGNTEHASRREIDIPAIGIANCREKKEKKKITRARARTRDRIGARACAHATIASPKYVSRRIKSAGPITKHPCLVSPRAVSHQSRGIFFSGSIEQYSTRRRTTVDSEGGREKRVPVFERICR